MSLSGQKVVVFGGSSGIGLATARMAADAGATVVVAGRDRDPVDAALNAAHVRSLRWTWLNCNGRQRPR